MAINTGIIIPVFNVEDTVKQVLISLENSSHLSSISEILFIDNNSGDTTVAIIEDYLKQSDVKLSSKVTFFKNKNNLGYGASIKIGMEYFSTKEVSHLCVIHGDYQVDPHWLVSRLFEGLLSGPDIDLALASRFKQESNISDYSVVRTLGNYFFNLLTSLCSGFKISDSGTAMMIVKRDVLGQINVANLSNSWQFHPQLNILLYGLEGIKIKEIPMNWSDSDAKSSLALFNYGYVLLKMLLRFWFKRVILRMKPSVIFYGQPLPKDSQPLVLHRKKKQQTSFDNSFSEADRGLPAR